MKNQIKWIISESDFKALHSVAEGGLHAVLVHLLQPGGLDSFLLQDLPAALEHLRGQGGRAGEDPGVLHVEDVVEVHAGVDHGVGGVVCGQDPVWDGGDDWGRHNHNFRRQRTSEEQRSERRAAAELTFTKMSEKFGRLVAVRRDQNAVEMPLSAETASEGRESRCCTFIYLMFEKFWKLIWVWKISNVWEFFNSFFLFFRKKSSWWRYCCRNKSHF